MKLLKGKQGRLSTEVLVNSIIAIILLVILFEVYAELVPVAQSSGNTLNASGVPLGNLFVGDGVVFIIIMAALLIVVVVAFLVGLRVKGGK